MAEKKQPESILRKTIIAFEKGGGEEKQQVLKMFRRLLELSRQVLSLLPSAQMFLKAALLCRLSKKQLMILQEIGKKVIRLLSCNELL